MALAMPPISPVAPWPLGLGGVRQLTVAALLDPCGPPPPAPVLSWGRGGAALLLALLEGPHALSTVGARREDRGRVPFLPPGLTRAALQAARRGQRRAALLAAPLHRGFGALALQALEGSALSPPWLPQDTPTLPLGGV
jgi:hypothetical protein